MIKEKHPEFTFYRLNNTEEEFNKFLQSENALIKLLDFVSIVCILISVFGIFSLVTLNCEQRRKEIAIRKVNGASVGTIIRMFFKEYLLLLCVAAAIAFTCQLPDHESMVGKLRYTNNNPLLDLPDIIYISCHDHSHLHILANMEGSK